MHQVAPDALHFDVTQHHDDGVVVRGEELDQHVGGGLGEEDLQQERDLRAHPHFRRVL